jgi:hypothetical protein
VLRFEVRNDAIAFSNVGWVEPQPTRFMGEPWEWIAVELACGIADPFPDVGLLIVAAPDVREPPHLDATNWAVLPGDAGKDIRGWACSFDGKWHYIPRWREAVEEIVYYYQPLMKLNEEPFELRPSASVVAFSGYAQVAETLRSSSGQSQAIIDRAIQTVLKSALFELDWNVGAWNITPRSASLDHLMKLAEPVVSRINASIIEC